MTGIALTDANRGISFMGKPVSRDALADKIVESIQRFYNGSAIMITDDSRWSDIDNLYVINFNRVYPSTVKLNFPADKIFVLKDFKNIKGNSHDVLTVYHYREMKGE